MGIKDRDEGQNTTSRTTRPSRHTKKQCPPPSLPLLPKCTPLLCRLLFSGPGATYSTSASTAWNKETSASSTTLKTLICTKKKQSGHSSGKARSRLWFIEALFRVGQDRNITRATFESAQKWTQNDERSFEERRAERNRADARLVRLYLG